MAKQGLFTTVEIELVLRLYSLFRKGQKLELTAEEHQFLKQQFRPEQFTSALGGSQTVMSYRNWVVLYNSGLFNINGGEMLDNAIQPNWDLEGAINKHLKYQQADILRNLWFHGRPVEVLLQCAMIEMVFQLGHAPRRSSDAYPQVPIMTLARELQENGTFNI
jgi:hypothetical protein